MFKMQPSQLKTPFIVFIAVLVLIGCFATAIYLLGNPDNFNNPNNSNNFNNFENYESSAINVIDGDTFEINGGIKVRLIGIDTPEMKNKNRTIDCFATEAKQKVESLLNGKEVVLVKDVSETDKYGRLLRYVYLGDEMIKKLKWVSGRHVNSSDKCHEYLNSGNIWYLIETVTI